MEMFVLITEKFNSLMKNVRKRKSIGSFGQLIN